GGSVGVAGQGLFSCRSPRESAKMTIWALAAMFAMLLLITLPVLGMLAAEPHLYHATASEREQVYGQMLARYLPAGALGLVLAGILASVMSTISSHLNYGAQTVVNDVLRPLLPGARYLDPQRRECLWVGRVATLAILLCGVGVMFAADSLFRIAAVIAGMFASSAAFFWAQWWWWRVNFPAWVAAMLGGPVVYFTLGTLLPRGAWWQEQLARSEAAADSLAMLQAVIAMGLTTLLWVAVAWLTPPESNETLTRFYRHARPMGSWGPVRRLVADHVPADLPAEPSGLLAGGLAVAVIGAVTAALAALGLSQACVGQWVAAGCLLAGALAAATVFRASFGWHMNRLEAE
ncbi:MAG TPA: hypothetical protein PJ982_18945, partial [Lacipirellulaceae bacterium]|nr:hypothetical protein [Lacipirellulaceae bacterium]